MRMKKLTLAIMAIAALLILSSCLSFNPESVDFPCVPVGITGIHGITIKNNSLQGINVSAPAVNDNHFTTDRLNTVLSSGDEVSIEVRFEPDTPGTFNATLQIISTSGNASGTESIPLSGTAVSAEEAERCV